MRKLIVPAVVMAVVSAVSCNKISETGEVRSLSADAFISGSTKTDYAPTTDENGNPIVKVTWSDEDSFKAYYEGSKNPIIFSKTAAGSSFSATDVPEGVSAETVLRGYMVPRLPWLLTEKSRLYSMSRTGLLRI